MNSTKRKHYRIEKDLDIDEFIKICKNSVSMSEASSKLGIHFNSFKRIAEKLDCYKPNQGLKGAKKPRSKFPLEKILNGEYPNYQTLKLKKRLFDEGVKEKRCEICGLTAWQNKEIPLELDHIDGNKYNHKLDNLRIVCPNCHSILPHFRGANKKNMDH